MPFGLGGGRNTGINPRAAMGGPPQGGSGLVGMLQRKMAGGPPPPGLAGPGPNAGVAMPPPNGLLSSLVAARPGLGSAAGPNFAPGPRRMARRMGRGY